MATLKVTNIKNESFAGDQLYLKTDGTIGIGTTSPSRKLHLVGSNAMILIEGSGGNGRQYSLASSDDTTGAAVDGGNPGTFAIYDDTANISRLVINSSGKVGIGTTSPDTNLEINGGADAIAKVTGTTTAARLDLKTNSHHRFIQTLESDGAFRIYDQTNGSERLRVTSGGRILIATTSEGHSNADDLTIATAAGSLGNTGITIRSSTTGDGNIFFSDATSGDGETKGVIKYSHNGDSLKFNTAGQQRLEINSDGDIEVGGNLKTNNLPGRNLIINGAFTIAQRGTSSTDQSYKTVDRFTIDYGGHDEVLTQSQHALTSSDTGPWAKGFRYSYHIQNGNQTSGADAADYIRIVTRLEAQDLANSGWAYTDSNSYATLSFWVISSVAQTFYGQVFSQDGSPKNFPFSTGALSQDTWTKVEIKIPGGSGVQFDNNNKQGMVIYWWPFGGTNYTGSPSLNTWAAFSSGNRIPDMTSTWWTTNDATFELTGVQLEVGSIATEFEHRSYGEELARCQRYLYRSSGNKIVIFNSYNSATDNFWAEMYLPTTMRAAPTTTVTSIGAGALSSTTMSIDQLSFQSTTGNTHFSNGTIIEASAEL